MGKGTLTKNLIYVLFLTLLISGFFAFFTKSVFASSTDGAIDNNYKYAWGENIGWINFGCDNCNVHITDAGLSGYALSENIGWIYLGDITNNNGGGTLSGNAWSENTGWIKFNPTNGGVIINSSGEFTGSALGENIGWIIFNGNYKVKTDWRPRSARPACNNSLDDNNNGLIDYPADPGCSSLDDTDENTPQEGGIISYYTPPVSSEPTVKPEPTIEPPPPEITPEEIISETTPIVEKPPREPIIEKIPEFLKPLIPGIFKPKPLEIKQPEIIIPEDIKPIPTTEEIKEIFPVLQISSKSPGSILEETKKENYYQVAKTKSEIGKKFDGISLAFKEFGEELKETPNNIKVFAVNIIKEPVFLIKDLSYALGEGALKSIKDTFGLSRSVGRLAVLQFNSVGRKITGFRKSFGPDIAVKPEPSIVPLEIIAKPENIIVKSAFGNIELPQKDGIIVSLAGLNIKSFVGPKDNAVKSVRTEIYLQKMALKDFDNLNNSGKTSFLISEARAEEFVEFEGNRAKFGEYSYTKNKQGFWEAIMVSPAFAGEYELKTIIEYQNGENKEILNLMVVKIRGWVYYSHPKGQIRLSNAKAELYHFNGQKGLFELWPAGIYGQRNPQITNDSGEYAFLLPEGRYYLNVSKDGYLPYKSEEFELKEPNILNQTIALSELEF